jgi:S-adenosylmethionine:tRNA ribosyltransferase-isomerase
VRSGSRAALRATIAGITTVPTYELAESAIAQTPIEPRDAARLLVDRGAGVEPDHRSIADLPSLLRPGDLVVVNETRVRRARLLLERPTGGSAEVLLLEECGDGMWEALVRPDRKLRAGTKLSHGGVTVVEVGARLGDGHRHVRLVDDQALERFGRVPLPPYIRTSLDDDERYQTVYATVPGSVAAPTAGLHLTDRVLAGVRQAGADIATVDLAVGVGTFRPVTADRIEDHPMHEERYAVPEETLARCADARRVIAVGTTTVRALETVAVTGDLAGRTRLLITSGHDWRVVDAMLTNFHQPRSTLLCLVEAFVGARWRELYDTALREGYRFLSFGDAMFLERAERVG